MCHATRHQNNEVCAKYDVILGVQRCRGDVTTPRYVFTGSALLTRILGCEYPDIQQAANLMWNFEAKLFKKQYGYYIWIWSTDWTAFMYT